MAAEQALQVFNPATIADDIDEMAFADLGSFNAGGAGDCFIVSRGCWHRQPIHQRSKEFYLSPAETLHSHAEYPRVE